MRLYYINIVPFKSCCLHLSPQVDEGFEILLGPEVTYGPAGIDLCFPVVLTITHCAQASLEDWSIKLKRKTQENKWEVRLPARQC